MSGRLGYRGASDVERTAVAGIDCQRPAYLGIVIILAHGAGAGMDSDFMNAFAVGVAGDGFRPSDSSSRTWLNAARAAATATVNRSCAMHGWTCIASVDAERLIIGGNSLGGRIVRLIADEAEVAGLICLGYLLPNMWQKY